jgi:septum site-determining protein MinD
MKTIGIISLKGGVGKTSTVIALGASMAGFGKKVLLVDGNLSAPDLGIHLNMFDSAKTLHHVLNRKANISDVVHTSGNFDMIPASVFTNIITNPFELKNKIKNIKRRYDIIIIDSSPALNNETLAVMLAADKLLVVTTPDCPSLSSTLKAVKLAKERGTPICGLVLNKVYNKNFELSLDEIESVADVPVMAVIPYDINILKALYEFTPFPEYSPDSKAAEEYKRLAAALIGERYKPVKLKRFFRWINPKKQDINREIYYKRMFD